MKPIVNSIMLRVAVLSAAAALLGAPLAVMAQTGQVALGQSTVEPAFDDGNGNVIYLLTPDKSPFPSKANAAHASAPLYMVVYPLASQGQIDSTKLNCTPENCNHLEVLPFYDPIYDPNYGPGAVSPFTDDYSTGMNQACKDFNGGLPCTPVLGHDHLVGIASTGGDFNIDWDVQLVLFLPPAWKDGTVYERITTLAQIQALKSMGDVTVVPTGIDFTCSKVSSSTYLQGTPVHIVYP